MNHSCPQFLMIITRRREVLGEIHSLSKGKSKHPSSKSSCIALRSVSYPLTAHIRAGSAKSTAWSVSYFLRQAGEWGAACKGNTRITGWLGAVSWPMADGIGTTHCGSPGRPGASTKCAPLSTGTGTTQFEGSLVGLARAQDILCAISPHPKSGAGTNCSGTVAGRAQINVHPQPPTLSPSGGTIVRAQLRSRHSFVRPLSSVSLICSR